MRKGQKHTKESNEKNRVSHFGKIFTEEHRRKIRENSNGFTGKHTEASRKKMSVSKKKLFAEGKITPWNYIDGKALKRDRLQSKQLHHIYCKKNNLSCWRKGFLVHHLDGNPKNNNNDNLVMMDKPTHNKIHNDLMKIQTGRTLSWQS